MPDRTDQLRQFKADVFRLLAHPTRVHILECLGDGEMQVSELLERIGVEPANLSQHLSLLKARGLVVKQREGGQSFYQLSDPLISDVLEAMRRYFAAHVQETLSTLQEAEAKS